MFRFSTKNLLPKSLYGRALLILIVPIVVLQLVVTLIFLQRHYDRVTQQMTRTLVLEVSYLLEGIESANDLSGAQAIVAARAAPLQFSASLPSDVLTENRREFSDLAGRAMVRTLDAGLDTPVTVDFVSNWRRVAIGIETKHGNLRLEFPRVRIAASNPHQLLVWMIFIGVLMTFIAYVFLRNQLRPIKQLAVAATNFGRGEATTYRPRGAVEVRQAGKAFLEMRARIERQIEQRTLMLSGVSHDLRTPLTRLRLGLSMIDDEDETAPLLQDLKDMETLLDAFLDFSRGEATDEHEDVDPVALARSVVEDARRNGSSVEFLADESDGRMKLRPTSVRRALANLVGNALRYGHRARVSVDLYEKAVRFRVEDDGPGIPEKDRASALRPFSRLEPARNQNKGAGVGLGLSIAADIARGHGGSLRLSESAAMGGLQVDLVVPR